MSDTGSDSVTQNHANDNEDDEENVIAELYGDERDQCEEEDGENGEDLYGDDMMRFFG
jgi:hypothetical protein